MEHIIREPESYNKYVEMCGCVWKQGHRVYVCARHKHKDGITPDRISTKDILMNTK